MTKEKKQGIAVSYEEWLLYIILVLIPLINLLILLYFSFNSKINPSKKSLSRAILTYIGVVVILTSLSILLS